MSKLCWNCCERKSGTKCSGCLVARYCDKECQLIDWKQKSHRKECKKWKAIAEMPYTLTTEDASDIDPMHIDEAKNVIDKLVNAQLPNIQSQELLGRLSGFTMRIGGSYDFNRNCPLTPAVHAIGYDWIVLLMKKDMTRRTNELIPYPIAYNAFNSLLGTSNNQVDRFKAKNFLLTPDAFETLFQYCHFFLFEVPQNPAIRNISTVLWRYMNLIFVHPFSCNIALKFLHEDQRKEKILTKMITKMMNSDGIIPDSIEGLIYQTVALIDLQSDVGVEGITDNGVNKDATINNIVSVSYLKQMYEEMAKPVTKQYIKMQKTRL